MSLFADVTARDGGLHVPPAPFTDSGLGDGAVKAVPLRLRIIDTDVSKFNVECILEKWTN